MAERRPPITARIIPLSHLAGGSCRSAAGPFRTGTKTIRPLDALLLAPVAIPVVIAILILLLAWFVLWLATVGVLAVLLVTADIARAALSRAGGVLFRALDRRAVSFQAR